MNRTIAKSADKTAKKRRHATLPLVESIEPRRLLTVVVGTPDVNKLVTITSDAQPDDVTITHIIEIDPITGETLRNYFDIAATAQTDTIYNLGEVSKFNIDMGGGNDSVNVDSSVTLPTTILGGAGNDSLYGGDGTDRIDGGAGDDYMDGRRGADFYIGGTGIDTVSYRDRNGPIEVSFDGTTTGDDGEQHAPGLPSENDVISDDVDVVICGTGNDLVDASASVDGKIIYGNEGNDTLIGGIGNDRLVGNAGDDSMNGNEGNDTLLGSFGKDTYLGGTGNDLATFYFTSTNLKLYLDGTPRSGYQGQNATIFSDVEGAFGGTGNDLIVGNSSDNFLYGQAGKDTIQGLAGDDSILGGSGNDVIDGGAGNDTIRGGNGYDTITGGDGADNLFGDNGKDTFYAKDNNPDNIDGGLEKDTVASKDDVIDSLTNI